MLWPNGTTTRPNISSPFGPRQVTQAGASSNHLGCDFTGFARVHAVAAGTVVQVGWRDGWAGGGYMVWIQHDGFLSRSLHMVDGSALVRVGDRVAEGQAIGTMGRTARPNPVGLHLHLEIVVGGRQIDPVPFITARLSSSGSAAATITTAQKGSDMRNWLFFRRASNGNLAAATGSETLIFTKESDYRKIADIFRLLNARDKTIPRAPSFDKASEWFSLDEPGWALLVKTQPQRSI